MSSIKYVPVPLVERLPEKLELGGTIESQSVVVARNTREYLPTTGGPFSFNSQNIMEIQMSDSGYFDLQTLAMTYNLKVLTPTGGALTCAENGYAPFRRAELVINGVVVSVVDNIPQLVGMVVASTSNQDYYDTFLSRSGFWLDNKSMRLSTGAGVASDIDDKATIISAQQQSALGQDVWLDLSPVFRLFAESVHFFPMRNISSMIIRFYLSSNSECLISPANFAYAGGATVADATATYALNNVKLNVDSVQLTPSFTQSYDQFIASTASMPEGGLNILFSDYTVQRSLVADGQEVDILLSKACKYLCSIYGSLHQTTDLTNIRRVKSERQKIANLTGAQIVINGQYYPQTRPLSRAQVLAETDKAWNRAYDTLAQALQSQTTACGYTSYKATAPGVPASVSGNFDDTDPAQTDAAIDGAIANPPGFTGAGVFPDIPYGILNHGCFGINMEQVIMGGSSSVLNGLSLVGGAPAIVKLFSNVGFPSGGLGLTGIFTLYYKKVLKIRGDNNVELIE